MDEMSRRPEERCRLRRDVAHLFRRNETAIGPAGKPRPLRAQQRLPHRREDAVGGEQHIGLDLDAVVEPCPDLVGVLLDADAAMRQMDTLGWNRLGQHRMQFASMENVMRRAELLLDSVAERRLRQGAAVIPAALMEERRAVRHLGAFLAETQPDQDARGVRPDIDAGADLAEQARLLVDLNVEAGLQQADRRGQPADAAADDGDPHRHLLNFRMILSENRFALFGIMRRACRAPGRSPPPRSPGQPPRTPPAAA